MIKKLRIRITAVIMIGLTILITAVISGIYIFMLRSETEETDRSVNTVLAAIKRESDKREFEKNQPSQKPESTSSSNESEKIQPPQKPENTSSSNESEKIQLPQKPENTSSNDNEKIQPPQKPENTSSSNDSGNNQPPQKPEERLPTRNWISVLADSDGNIENTEYSSVYGRPDEETDLYSAAQNILGRGTENGYISFGGVSYRYFVRKNDSGTRIIFIDRTNQQATMRRLMTVLVFVGIGALFILFPISIMVSGWVVKPIERAWNNQKEFFANASHELKTPLTVISANVDVIMSNPDETVAAQEKWFEYIKSEAVKMSKLINQMLYLSKEDRDEEELLMADFNASDAIEGACLAFEALAFERGRMLESEIEPDITARGDKERIVQLAHILIDNAIVHSDSGGTVNVSFRRKKNKNILTVSNTGDYIPPEELSRLFDRFYRTDKSRNSATGGFGLGLSIAGVIAEKHGGTLTASSVDSGVTTFTFIW